jgi:aryl-alcohol dehydrogenase-like predicted oxidoreductase
MLAGFATSDGTARFAARFAREQAAGFYRDAQGFLVSSIGIGTYLGEMDEATDQGYADAIASALGAGVNVIDTSLNYRNQHSERSIARALRACTDAASIQRDEVVLCTKAGYLVPDAVPNGVLSAQDVVQGMHSMAPAFLADQLGRSLQNLAVQTIDVFYLHNPETQLGSLNQDEFYARIRRAFEFLEQAAGRSEIRYYGTATWEGYRRPQRSGGALSLNRLAAIAHEVGGTSHHFRFIQLPLNLAMPEAFANRDGGENVLDAAQRLGVTVIASASLLQARLARNLPSEIRDRVPGASTDAQRAIQFTRSTPGVAVALIGMSSVAHVRENLALASVPPLNQQQYASLYGA